MSFCRFYNLRRLLTLIFLSGIFSQINAFSQSQLSFPASKFKNWISFNGQSGSYVEFKNSSFWKPDPDFTLECWIRLGANAPQIFQHIFGNCWPPVTSSTLENNWGFGFALINNRLGFHIIINGTSIQQYEVSSLSDTLSTCRWYHLAGVKQGNQARLYIDGILKATRTLPLGSIRATEGPAHLGTNYSSGFNNWFEGSIDELRLWRYARSEDQIFSKMADTLVGNEPGLSGYFRFDDQGQGSNVLVKNYALISSENLDGVTRSDSGTFPIISNVQPFVVPPAPNVLQQTITYCYPGGSSTIAANYPQGFSGNRFFLYRLMGSDTVLISSNALGNFELPYSNNSEIFYVSYVNSNKCESLKTSISVTVSPMLQVSVSPQTSFVCPGDSVFFSGQVMPQLPGRFSWFRSSMGQETIIDSTLNGPFVGSSFLSSDTVFFKFTSNNNCVVRSDFSIIKVKDTISIVLFSSNICFGEKSFVCYNKIFNPFARVFIDSLNSIPATAGLLKDSIFFNLTSGNHKIWVSISDSDTLCGSIIGPLEINVREKPIINVGFFDQYLCSFTSLPVEYKALANQKGGFLFWDLPPVMREFAIATDSSLFIRWNQVPISNEYLFKAVYLGAYCPSDSVFFNIKFDFSTINIRNVSTLVEDDKIIRINYKLNSIYGGKKFKKLALYRDFVFLDSIPALDSIFTDYGAITDQKFHQYYISFKNQCGMSNSSKVLNSIFLRTNYNLNLKEVVWNDYNGNGEVVEYLLYDPYSGFPYFVLDTIKFISPVSISRNFIGTDFKSLRVKYRDDSGDVSFSNVIDAASIIEIPSLVTSNGDFVNDKFEIKGIYNCKNCYLEIYDRWGNLLFNQSNYMNNWSGPGGTYFYKFKCDESDFVGYFTVIR